MLERASELEKMAQGLKEDYLRALADFDNFRKRMEREMKMSEQLGVEKLMVDILPVLDDLERALNAAGATSNNTDRSIIRGFELIYKNLCSVLERHGLQAYCCIGEEFDPRRAEAVGFVETESGNDGVVVEEVCRGYERGGKVLRAAKVKVSKVVENK